ncbi:MAG: RsmD family RNA methyltransferase, partial [Verrucomicrobiae bacterium]|nr:RsmD family RNA methyltransferase [Verrucomicrobiae bacterium]
MRITGGAYAGRVLRVPKGFEVRPATDVVRQAVFNSLGERIANAVVLDLFAGTGSFAFESLSRGARGAMAIDSSPGI